MEFGRDCSVLIIMDVWRTWLNGMVFGGWYFMNDNVSYGYCGLFLIFLDCS